MKEKQNHIDAFDYFYQLGGAVSAENCTRVADKFQISERIFWNWYKNLGWKERVHLRNIEVSKGVEEKTNSTTDKLKHTRGVKYKLLEFLD